MDVLKEIKKGAFWVLLFSLLGGPIALLRNWLFTYYDPTGLYIADFAIVMILFNLITTFFIFGGSSVLTTFVPKIDSIENKRAFLLSYTGISLSLFILLVILLLIFPQSIVYLTNGRIQANYNLYVVLLAVPVLFSQIFIYFLQGNMDYKTSSFLSQLPNFINTLIVLILISFYVPIDIINIDDSLIIFLSIILVVSCLLSIILSLIKLKRILLIKQFDFFIPKGFWHFSTHVHILTLITFFYQNIDQIFILKVIGLKELGYYFIIIQLVETVRFIPLKIGQVLLASFSKLAQKNDQKQFSFAYAKVGRIIILLNLLLTLFLIVFSDIVLGLFTIPSDEYRVSFIVLLMGYNISAIGNLNTMALLSVQRSKEFLFNSLLILFSLLFFLLIFKNLEFFGVILSKVLAITIGQIGLFLLVYKYVLKTFSIKKNYMFSQIFLFIIGFAFIYFDFKNILFQVFVFIILIPLIFYYYKFTFSEILRLLKFNK